MSKKKPQAAASEMLSKDSLSQFMKALHAQVQKQILQGEMDSHLGYECHLWEGCTTGKSVLTDMKARWVEDILITGTDNSKLRFFESQPTLRTKLGIPTSIEIVITSTQFSLVFR